MNKELIEYAKSLWQDNDGDSAMQMLIDYLRTKDMAEVVRCRECIYYKEKGYDSHPYCYYFDEPWSPSRGISREPDDFCSRGERKTE